MTNAEKHPTHHRSSVPSQSPKPESIEQQIGDVIEPLVTPERKNALVTAVMQVVAESYSGPLPHPDHFQAYEDALPGSADRILAMAEKQQTHRMWWEKVALIVQAGLAGIGQVFGLVVSLAMLYFAYQLGLAGQPWLGAALVGATTVGMVTAFIKGRPLFGDKTPEPTPPPPTRKKTPTNRRRGS